MLSEKVDTTVSKGVLRIVGTAVGGTFGVRLTPCGHSILSTLLHASEWTYMHGIGLLMPWAEAGVCHATFSAVCVKQCTPLHMCQGSW